MKTSTIPTALRPGTVLPNGWHVVSVRSTGDQFVVLALAPEPDPYEDNGFYDFYAEYDHLATWRSDAEGHIYSGEYFSEIERATTSFLAR